MREALNNLANQLEQTGAQVSRNANVPDLGKSLAAYGEMMRTLMSRGAPGATPIDAHRWMELVDEQMRTTRSWAALFQDVDVMLTPPFGTPAFPHIENLSWETSTLEIDDRATPYRAQVAWPAVATFPGLPATAAPIGTTKEGLPIGVQIIANQYEDRTSLCFAKLLEQAGLAKAA